MAEGSLVILYLAMAMTYVDFEMHRMRIIPKLEELILVDSARNSVGGYYFVQPYELDTAGDYVVSNGQIYDYFAVPAIMENCCSRREPSLPWA